MNNQTKPDSAAPGGDVEQMIKVLREIDGIRQAIGASEEIGEQYREACCTFVYRNSEALIAALSAPKRVDAAANDVRPGDGHRWGDFSRNELCDLIDQLSDQVRGTGTKQWPFVESPGALANRIDMATRDFPLVGALRHVFIENPPTFIIPQPAPQPVEAEGREASPNWCRTCGKHWDDPKAVFCSDGIHNRPFAPQPEQPAIDLEQFRPAVEATKRYGERLHAEGAFLPEQYDNWTEKADHLLAIIDGAKGERT